MRYESGGCVSVESVSGGLFWTSMSMSVISEVVNKMGALGPVKPLCSNFTMNCYRIFNCINRKILTSSFKSYVFTTVSWGSTGDQDVVKNENRPVKKKKNEVKIRFWDQTSKPEHCEFRPVSDDLLVICKIKCERSRSCWISVENSARCGEKAARGGGLYHEEKMKLDKHLGNCTVSRYN